MLTRMRRFYEAILRRGKLLEIFGLRVANDCWYFWVSLISIMATCCPYSCSRVLKRGLGSVHHRFQWRGCSLRQRYIPNLRESGYCMQKRAVNSLPFLSCIAQDLRLVKASIDSRVNSDCMLEAVGERSIVHDRRRCEVTGL